MKKSTKILFTALASLSLLVSCQTGGTSSQTSEVQSSEAALVVDAIKVTADTTLVVGTEYDFDAYVELASKVELTEEQATQYDIVVIGENAKNVTITGHKVIINVEGEYTFKITAGDKSTYHIVDAISQIKNKYKLLTENVTSNYFTGYVEFDQNGGATLYNAGWIHNENYFAYYEDIYTGGTTDSYIGLLKNANEDVYQFSVKSDGTTNLKVDPGKASTLVSLGYFGDFCLDYTYFDTYTEQGYSYLLASGEAGDELAYNWCSAHNLGLPSGITGQVMIEFAQLQDGSELPLVYVLGYNAQGQLEFMLTQFLIFDESACSLPGVDAYIEAGNAPTAISATEISSKITEIVNTKNFTVKYHAAWEDAEGNTIAETEVPDWFKSNWIYQDYGNENATAGGNMFFRQLDATVSVTADAYHIAYKDLYTNTEGYDLFSSASGSVVHETNYELDDMLHISPLNEVKTDNTSFVTSSSVWSENFGVTNIWGPSYYAGLAREVTGDELNVYAKEVDSESGNVYFTISNYDSSYLVELLTLFPWFGDLYFTEYYFELPMLADANGNEFTLGEYLMPYTYVTVASDSVFFEFECELDETCSYVFTIEYCNAGTTVIPA